MWTKDNCCSDVVACWLGCFGGESKLIALYLFILFVRADDFIVHDIGGGAFVL